MSLPGKLCVGILEEDNPLRSYFRFKPLLVDDNGRYVPYEDGQRYPQEGCIRIVPDKNESYHFKARMRQIGLFCIVDLRQHPGESDKIRPNKNFRPEGEEINANIIYSDVVRAPAEATVFEILSSEAAEKPLPPPHTPAVLLRESEGISPAKRVWKAIPDADDIGYLADTEEICALEDMQVFDLPGFRDETVSFAIRPAKGLDRVSDLPVHAAQSPAPAPRTAEKVPAPADRPEPPAPEPAPTAGEKPWIHRDDSMLPPPVSAHLSRSEQLMAAQAGLNPRRGRSLQELIDEKWQRSRLNQLGQPVQPIATGAPVENPVEAAMNAVREVWRQPQLRGPLMESLGALGELRQSLEVRRETSRHSAIAAELEALEAQKLQLMGELDHLKAGTAEIRQRLKQEIQRDEAQALAEAVRRTEDARAEQARCEQLAADARAAAQDAQALVEKLSGDALEEKIREVALTRRVLERLDALKAHPAAPEAPASAQRIDLEECIQRVTRRFAARGWALSRLEATNLCVCLAVSPALILIGAPGSGKSTAAALLAEALGLKECGRTAAIAPGAAPGQVEERLEALRRSEALPAAILLDDANLAPQADPMRDLAADLPSEWRIIATLQDAHSGLPVSAAAWNRGFAVRLTPPDDLPWRPAPRTALEPEALASIDGILETLPSAEVPTALEERLNALRSALTKAGASVSRRALDEAWRYTSAMLAVLKDAAAPEAILDLAVAQRVLPALLASAPLEALANLRPLLAGMPACMALLDQPLPLAL